MFDTWLQNNKLNDFDWDGTVFEKASNRDFWEKVYREEYVKNAEKYLGYSWPLIRASDYMAYHTEGNRLKQETPHYDRREALSALFIGELMEHRGRFLPDIVDGIFLICEESYWGVSAHKPPYYRIEMNLPDPFDRYIDLFVSETASLIATIYHVLHDELYAFCPEIVKRMANELEDRIVKPYLSHFDYWWMGYYQKTNNWNPWILSNVVTVFLFLEMPKATFFEGIYKLLHEINFIYKLFPDDGGCDEGPTYWKVSGGALFEFLEQIYLATNGKVTFFEDEKIKNIGTYPFKAYIGNNYFVISGDGGCRGDVIFKSRLYGYGKRTGNKNLCALANEVARGEYIVGRMSCIKTTLFNIIYREEIEAQPPVELSDEAWVKSLERVFCKNGEWYYAARGGNNDEFHNHNDVGSFVAFCDGKPVLVDPGCGDYTKAHFVQSERYKLWCMRSEWHNLPTINGICEEWGGEWRTEGFDFSDKVCRMGLSSAYSNKSGLEKFDRTIRFANGVELSDSFAFEKDENTIEENFTTPLEVEIKGNSVVIGTEYLLEADTDCEITVAREEFSHDKAFTKSWKNGFLNRLTFKFVLGKTSELKFNLRRI